MKKTTKVKAREKTLKNLKKIRKQVELPTPPNWFVKALDDIDKGKKWNK